MGSMPPLPPVPPAPAGAPPVPALAPPAPPRGSPPPDPDFDEQVEKLKRARDAAAESLRLERGFLMPRQQLEAIARMRPRSKEELMQVEDMRRWQVEALGDRLLKTVRGR